jgi:hypothetical protein
MKKFVTGLFLVLAPALVANAQQSTAPASVNGVEVLHSYKQKAVAPSVFISKTKFADPFAAPQDPPDDEVLGYYNVDMDQAAQWLNFPLPDSLFDQNQVPTFQKRALGTRFTTTLTNPILDSVALRMIVTSLDPTAGKGIKLQVYRTFWSATTGDPTAHMPFPDITASAGKIGKEVEIPSDEITLDDPSTTDQLELSNNTVVFKNASTGLVGLNLKSGSKWLKDFCVMVNPGFSGTLGTATTTNSISLLTDQVVTSSHDAGEAYDTTTDRSYWIGNAFDANGESVTGNVTTAPMGGSYTFQGETLYPNFIMVAYLHNQPLNGVDAQDLSGNALGVNFPNPVNESTEIPFSLAVGAQTTVKVYNTLGNLVATAFDGYQGAGAHSVKVNTENLTTGTYYYTINAGGFTATKSMIVAK